MSAAAFDPEAVAAQIDERLRALGTAERAAREKRYLKSELTFFGARVPEVRAVVNEAVGELAREDAVSLAVALWREPVHERRIAAVEVLRRRVHSLDLSDLDLVEKLIRESRTWALVDELAASVAGMIAVRDRAAWRRIDAWVKDPDFWVRRSALLALLPGVRAGEPDLDRFERYAVPLLGEREFFIRKAIGWVLREISKRDPGWVIAWTREHNAEMSGVTFREAVRRLPLEAAAELTRARARRR